MTISYPAKTVALLGAFVTLLTLPSISTAQQSVPLKFKTGDVISADVINELLSRLSSVQQGFSSNADLDGDWDCTTYADQTGGDTRCIADGLLFKKSGVVSFSAATGTWSYDSVAWQDSPLVCGKDMKRGQFQLVGSYLMLKDADQADYYHFLQLTRTAPLRFTLQRYLHSVVLCSKKSTAPSPSNDLVASVAGQSVSLTWLDQSSDEDGFKIQRKATAAGAWATVATVGTNVTAYSEVVPSGVYWYRVIATNSFGDSISSSEVQVTVQQNLP